MNNQCKFQIIHYVKRNGKKQNSFPVGLAEFFHGDSKAKLVLEILNKIGLCTSYDELQRIDFGLMKLVNKTTGTNRVPVFLTINKKHSFMEKWIISTTMKQHQELEVVITHLSCCFQNQNKNENSPKTLSKIPTGSSQNQKSLDKILCQGLTKIGHLGRRGKMPETFSGGDEIDSL